MSCYTLVEHLLRVHQYSYDNSMSFTEHLVRPDRTRLVDWVTRPSRAMSSTESEFDVVAGRSQCQRVLHTVCRVISRRRPAIDPLLGKPTNQGVNQLKYQRSLRSTAEERVGRRCANLRVLNSYWINQDSTYKYFEVILVDPQHKAIRKDPRINWIVNPVHKVRSHNMMLGHLELTITSTAKLVASPLLARSLGVSAKDTATITRLPAEGRRGRDTTPFLSGDTATSWLLRTLRQSLCTLSRVLASTMTQQLRLRLPASTTSGQGERPTRQITFLRHVLATTA